MAEQYWARFCLNMGLIAAAVAALAGWRALALGGVGPYGPAALADQASARALIALALFAAIGAGALLLGWLYLIDRSPQFWRGTVVLLFVLWVLAGLVAVTGLVAPTSVAGRSAAFQAVTGLILSIATAGIACVMPYRRRIADAAARENMRDGAAAFNVIGVLTLSGTTSADELGASYGSNTFRLVAIAGAGVMVFVYLFAWEGFDGKSTPTLTAFLVAAIVHLLFLMWMNARRRDWQASVQQAKGAET